MEAGCRAVLVGLWTYALLFGDVCNGAVSGNTFALPDCKQGAIDDFLNSAREGDAANDVPSGLYFSIRNSSVLGLNTNSLSLSRYVVRNGTVALPDIFSISEGVLPEEINNLELDIYRTRDSVISSATVLSCGLRSCWTKKSPAAVTEVEFSGSSEFNVPAEETEKYPSVLHIKCIRKELVTVRVNLNCVANKDLTTSRLFFVSFIFHKECADPQAPTTDNNAQIYGIIGAVGFILIVLVIVLVIVRSPTCRFTSPQEYSASHKTASTTTATAQGTLVTASNSSDPTPGSDKRDDSASSQVGSRSQSNVPDRSEISEMVPMYPINHDRRLGPLHLGSLSQGSDGTSGSFSFYEQSSIGHIEWQHSKAIEEITVPPDRILLGDVIRSSLSVQEIKASMRLSDGDRESVVVKAFTKAASGPAVKNFIFEALELRRAQSGRRRDMFHEIIGIVIPGDHVPPILVYRYNAAEENLLSWLLRMKSNEISRTPVETGMGWRGNSNEAISCTYLTSLGAQIARGCKHLAKYDIIHKDLAARNCIINTATNTVKIVDAIHSSELYPEGYMRLPSPSHLNANKIPLKWMAVEVFSEGIYSTSSDAWAFAVTLWEIFTLGRAPYNDIAAEEMESHLRAGNRLDQPLRCPNSIFAIIGTCWALNPHDRLTFYRISQRMGDELNRERYPPVVNPAMHEYEGI